MPPIQIHRLDVSTLSYAERVTCAALQGLLNRKSPRVFINYGVYDDPDARRTNEVFMDDAHWYGKYRDLLGNQDMRNLQYYREAHGFADTAITLEALLKDHLESFKGCVVWDDAQPDTINLAVMLAGLEDLVPVSPQSLPRMLESGLELKHDLRGRWTNRVQIYTWAFLNLFPRCEPDSIACVEPGWGRPEFLDYVVQNRVFTYSLASAHKGLGSTLLLLLAFGPAWLREWLSALRLDSPLRGFALTWMGWKSPEVRLANRIQRAVAAKPYPTIFGWHTRRDDELAFMLQLSSNGLRLVPAHLAGNFSFHSLVKPLGAFKPDPLPETRLDPDGIYVTFTLSDGDQLMMMNTAELGNWNSPARGSVPFNWETQPLLVELAPALLEKFTRTKTSQDCLIAGPSGAGYVVPPLVPDLEAYMHATAEVCTRAGIRVVTTYVADPPRRVTRQIVRHKGGLLGFLSGYAIVNRAPQQIVGNTVLIANEIPPVAHIWDEPEDLLNLVAEKIKNPGALPRFIGAHLFAYRTTLDEVKQFIEQHQRENVHFVRADEFLMAAHEHFTTHRK